MLSIEPQAGVAPIVHLIDQSHREINVGVYYLTDQKILAALKSARERGVAVRVMIEPKPYGMKPWQIRKEKQAILATGAQFRWVPPRFVSHGSDWAFYHAKYLCNGHEAEIGNPNFAWSDFHDARNYLYISRNPEVVRAVNAVFQADWTRTRAPAWAHRVLVLSPGTSVNQIVEAIDQPGAISIEDEEIGPYAPVINAIEAKGKLARIIEPATISPEDRRVDQELEAHGVQVRLLPIHPVYLHAKLIVGPEMAYIGSENLTQTSLENNREVGLLLNGRDVTALQDQFDKDWSAAQPHD